MRRSTHLPAGLLLVVTLFAALLHVCVLPLGTEAASDGVAHDHHHGHDAAAPGQALHTASCDVAAGTTRIAPVAASSSAPPLRVAAAPIVRSQSVTPITPAPSGSPPLFLLHAAPLI